MTPWEQLAPADALVAAVSHRDYLERPLAEILTKLTAGGSFIDVKSRFDRSAVEQAGMRIWRL